MPRPRPIVLLLMAALCSPGLASAQASVTQLAAGGDHSCARLSDGSVRCWGLNGSGQLGDGTTATRRTAVAVSGIASASAVSAGEFHSCALLLDGSVRCWGQNNEGQLGDGTTTRRLTPVAVSGLSQAVRVGAGAAHSCAVRADGSAQCWGSNGDGQLGSGNFADSELPVPVTGTSGLADIALGDSHTCAALSGGTARCWGWNGLGQLGNPNIALRSSIPVVVTGLSNVASVASGLDHACALLTTGAVRCWGYNFFGAVGDGSTTDRFEPAAVSGISNAVEIAAGFDHSCARLNDGTLKCWGSNQSGELGDGTLAPNRPSPVTLQGAPGPASAVIAGKAHSCAAFTGRGVYCWGSNVNGQLGNGGSANSLTPVLVSGLGSVAGAAVPALDGRALLALLALVCVLGARRVRAG